MLTNASRNTRRVISAMAAVFVVASASAALDPGQPETLRRGSIEVGELTPIHLEQLAVATLPGLEIVATRSQLAAAATPARDRSPG